VSRVPPSIERGSSEPPAWLRAAALASATAVLTLGGTGLALAIVGAYRPWLALPLGSVAACGLIALARPALRRRQQERHSAHAAAVVGLAAVALITLWNGAHVSQHVLINRDGGAYMNEGRWIARSGALDAHPRVGPFADQERLTFDSWAVSAMPDGSLQYQFAHLLPAVLAEGYALGGDPLMFYLPALISGVALLAFFVLAWRLFRQPWFSLAAMLVLALLMPQVSFSRDSYSELLSQVLLFTALWLVVSERGLPTVPVAFVSGMFVGGLQAAHIDAVVFLIGVPPLLAYTWLRNHGRSNSREWLNRCAAFIAGIVPGMALGLVDVMHHSGGYYSDQARNVKLLFLAVLGSVVASTVIATTTLAVRSRHRRLSAPRLRSSVSITTGIAVAVAGFGAWALRPRLQTLHSSAAFRVALFQAFEHQPIDATRTYFEHSLDWMAWYLGPITLALALVSMAILAANLVAGRRSYAVATVSLLVPASLLYIWKADATPDHIWVARRFLVATFPSLILLALGLLASLFARPSSRAFTRVVRGACVVVAISAIAYPARTVWPVRSMSEQRGFLLVVHDACRRIGPHAAVVVLESAGSAALFDDVVPQSLRGWCGADVAIMRGEPDVELLSNLAHQWATSEVKLFVIAETPERVFRAVPNADVAETRGVSNDRLLGPTLTQRPHSYSEERFKMFLARVRIDTI
jgi:hypothetical protein